MSPGVASLLPRVVPSSGVIIHNIFVPGGVRNQEALEQFKQLINQTVQTVVGMSSHFVHRDETIFRNPDNFIPERWLNDMSRDLDKWLVAFSKGPRSCLGSK
jgi:hypothetical protein